MNDKDNTKNLPTEGTPDQSPRTGKGLPESELEYYQFLEALPVAIANTTSDGKILYHNAYARRMLGYEPAELEQLRVEDIYVDPEDREDLIHNLQEKGVHFYEYRLRRKDGQIIWVRGTTQAIRDEEGNIVRLQGISEDVTERKRQEMEAATLKKVRDTVWAMRSADEIEGVMIAIKEGLKALDIPFHGLGVNVVERIENPLQVRHFDCLEAEDKGRWRTAEDDPGDRAVVEIWQEQKPVYRPDLTAQDQYRERKEIEKGFGPAVRSVIDVPFPRGTLAVNSTVTDAFSAPDIAFVESLAKALSEGFQRLDDLRELELRVREAEALARAIAGVSGTRKMDEVLQTVVLAATELMECSRSAVFLYDEGEEALVPQAAMGLDWEVYRDIRLQPGESASGHVFSTGESMLTPPGPDFTRYPLRPETQERFDNAMQSQSPGPGAVVALRLNDRIIGTLAVGGSHRWLGLRDLAIMEHLGEQAALAIDRARRTRELEEEVEARQQMEQSLRESEEKFRTLTENLPIGVYRNTTGPRGSFLEANPAVVQMFGYGSREEFLGIDVADLYQNPEDRVRFNGKMLREGQVVKEELQLKKKDGTELIGSVMAEAVKDDKGRVLYYDGIVEDITERKRLEEQLRIRQRMDALGTLAGGIAHDFNNLLTGIIGNLDMLSMQNEQLDELGRDCLQDAEQCCQRAADLIRQFQMLTKEAVSQKTAVDLFDVVEEVFGLLRETTDRLIDKRNMLHPGEFRVLGDASQLHQVLLNTVTNAIQAIEARGAKPGDYVRISAAADAAPKSETPALPGGEYVEISIEDTGIGMPEEVRSKVFDPYFTTRGESHGSGLGLAMVYNIVTQYHGGHIEVESQAGKGTAFHIYLPRALSSQGERRSEMTGMPRGEETILIVDDEEMVRNTAQRILETFGYTVVTAEDGIQGLDIYRERQDTIDAVLLDLTMPKMSGQMVLAELVQFDPGVKVIISSGHSSAGVEEKVHSRARGFASKPYEVKELLQTLRSVLDS